MHLCINLKVQTVLELPSVFYYYALLFDSFAEKQFLANFMNVVEKFEKFSSDNCSKCIILAYFHKNSGNNHGYFYTRLDTKDNLLEILRKSSQKFIRKLLQMHY